MRSNKKILASFSAFLLSVGAMGSVVVPAANAGPNSPRCSSYAVQRIGLVNGKLGLAPAPIGGGSYDCWLEWDTGYQNIVVTKLQDGLNKAEGYTLKLDGIFGKDTDYAVWNTQRGRSVTMDHVYGLKTGSAMYWYDDYLRGIAKWA